MRLHPALALAAILMLLGGCGTAPYLSRGTFEQPASRLTAEESNDIAIHAMGLVRPIAAQSLRSGDLVVFGRGRTPSHAGIYVGQGRFVHAPSSGGEVRLDSLDSRYWSGQRPAFRRP